MELIGRLLREMTACTVEMLRLRVQAKSSIQISREAEADFHFPSHRSLPCESS